MGEGVAELEEAETGVSSCSLFEAVDEMDKAEGASEEAAADEESLLSSSSQSSSSSSAVLASSSSQSS